MICASLWQFYFKADASAHDDCENKVEAGIIPVKIADFNPSEKGGFEDELVIEFSEIKGLPAEAEKLDRYLDIGKSIKDTLNLIAQKNCIDTGIVVYGFSKPAQGSFYCKVNFIGMERADTLFRIPGALNFDFPVRAQSISQFLGGIIKSEKGLIEESISHFEQAISIEEKSSSPQKKSFTAINNYYIGNVHLKAGEVKKAITSYSKSIEDDPKLSYAYQNRGKAYLADKQEEKAQEDFGIANSLSGMPNEGIASDEPKEVLPINSRDISSTSTGDQDEGAEINSQDEDEVKEPPKEIPKPPFRSLSAIKKIPSSSRFFKKGEESVKEALLLYTSEERQNWIVVSSHRLYYIVDALGRAPETTAKINWSRDKTILIDENGEVPFTIGTRDGTISGTKTLVFRIKGGGLEYEKPRPADQPGDFFSTEIIAADQVEAKIKSMIISAMK